MDFKEWKKLLNSSLVAATGLSSDDLPDWNYRDAYDSGMSPKVAAMKVLKSAIEFE